MLSPPWDYVSKLFRYDYRAWLPLIRMSQCLLPKPGKANFSLMSSRWDCNACSALVRSPSARLVSLLSFHATGRYLHYIESRNVWNQEFLSNNQPSTGRYLPSLLMCRTEGYHSLHACYSFSGLHPCCWSISENIGTRWQPWEGVRSQHSDIPLIDNAWFR